MTQIKIKKTNNQWYPYNEVGGYFKLEAGELMICAMNADGTRDDNPYAVDWQEVTVAEAKDKIAIERIYSDLQGRE